MQLPSRALVAEQAARTVGVLLLPLVLWAQEPATKTAPPFERGKGPVVAIDEAHRNAHTFGSPQFRGLVELLADDGYRVRPLATAITSTALSDLGVLIVSNPGGWQDK